jgi:hypothetical protein
MGVRLESYRYECEPQARTAACPQDTTESTSRFWNQSGRQRTMSKKLSEAPRECRQSRDTLTLD